MQYDAFISYSTSGDAHLARQLQHDLERLVKPWYRRRPFLRIFRDETGLAPGSDLDGRLTERLEQTGHLVLLLSPESADAYWVDLEVRHWLDRYGPDTIVPVITAWGGGVDANLSGFAWDGDDVPPSLRGALGTPLGVDLRWARVAEPGELHLGNDRWEQNVAQIAAAIRDQPPDEFFGALAAMRARARVLTGTITLAVALLLGAIAVAGILLLIARGEVSDAQAEVAAAQVELDGISATLEEREGELERASADLAEAQGAVEARQAELDAATDRLAQAQSDLDATQGDLDAARAEVDAANAAFDEAVRLRDAAEEARLSAQAQRDQAAIELAAARFSLDDTEAALRAAADELDATEGRLIDVEAERDAVEAERDQIALVEEAVSLAAASGQAAASGDAALGLVLAAEAMSVTSPPVPAAFAALVNARKAMATNTWQVLSGSIPPFEAAAGTPERLVESIGPGAGTLATIRVHQPTGTILTAWSGGPVYLSDPDTGTSRRVGGWGGPDAFVSPDGVRVVLRAATAVELRDVESSKLLGSFELDPGQQLYDVAFGDTTVILQMDGAELVPDPDATDGSTLTIGGGGFWTWDPGSGEPPTQHRQAQLFTHRLLGSGAAGELPIWMEMYEIEDELHSNVHVGEQAYPLVTPIGDGAPTCVTPLADGRRLAFSDDRGTVRLFDTQTGSISGPPLRALAESALFGFGYLRRDCGALAAELGRSGRMLTATTTGGVLRVWGAAGAADAQQIFDTRTMLLAAAWDERRQRVHLSSDDGRFVTVELRDPEPLRPIRQVERGSGPYQTHPLLNVTGSPYLLVGSATTVERFDTSSGLDSLGNLDSLESIGLLEITASPRFLTGFDFTTQIQELPSGDPVQITAPGYGWRLASGTDRLVGFTGPDRSVLQFFDVEVPRPELPTEPPAPPLVESVDPWSAIRLVPAAPDLAHGLVGENPSFAIAPDGTAVVVWTDDQLGVFDVASGRRVSNVGTVPSADVGDVLLIPPGNRFLMVHGSTVDVYDTSTAARITALEHERPVGNVSLSSDGRFLIGDGGRVLWDLRTGDRTAIGELGLDETRDVLFLGDTYRIFALGTIDEKWYLTEWDLLDPNAACDIARPYLVGRSLAPYLRGGRAALACR